MRGDGESEVSKEFNYGVIRCFSHDLHIIDAHVHRGKTCTMPPHHTYTHTHLHIPTHMHTSQHIHTHAHTHTSYMYIFVHTHTHTRTHTCKQTYTLQEK